MGELPPRRRGVTLKAGASLPELPRFQQSPGIVREAGAQQENTVQPAEQRDRPTDGKPLVVKVRVALDANNMEAAQKAIGRFGGSVGQLVNAAVRTMNVGEDDFAAVGVLAPRERLSDFSTVITCRIDRNLFQRWADKFDPFGVMKPGEIARGAVNHAFNRAASQFLQELFK